MTESANREIAYGDPRHHCFTSDHAAFIKSQAIVVDGGRYGIGDSFAFVCFSVRKDTPLTPAGKAIWYAVVEHFDEVYECRMLRHFQNLSASTLHQIGHSQNTPGDRVMKPSPQPIIQHKRDGEQ